LLIASFLTTPRRRTIPVRITPAVAVVSVPLMAMPCGALMLGELTR
jgi:hypothetical protein